MRRFLLKFIRLRPITLPDKYHDDFYREIIRENFSKLTIVSVIIFVLELVVFFNHRDLYKVGGLAYVFLCCHALFIPFIVYIWKHSRTIKLEIARVVAYGYCLCVLLFGAGLALYYQTSLDLVHMYVMVVLGLPNFIFMRPRNCAIILSLVYLAFAFALPYFQPDMKKVWVILPNTLLANVFALILNSMLYKSRIKGFMNKALLRSQKSLLEDIAQRDQMTGLYNHEVSLKKLESELRLARSIGNAVSL